MFELGSVLHIGVLTCDLAMRAEQKRGPEFIIYQLSLVKRRTICFRKLSRYYGTQELSRIDLCYYVLYVLILLVCPYRFFCL